MGSLEKRKPVPIAIGPTEMFSNRLVVLVSRPQKIAAMLEVRLGRLRLTKNEDPAILSSEQRDR